MVAISNRNSFALLILIFCFFILCFFYAFQLKTFSIHYLISVLIINIVIILCFISKKDSLELLTGQYLRVSNLFLLGFIIVHFQFYLDLVLGNFDLGRTDLIVDEKVILKSSIISTIALLSVIMGYFWKLMRTQRTQKKVNEQSSNYIELFGVRIMIYLFFLLFIISTPASYFRGGYVTVELTTISEYTQSFLILSIIGYLILNTRNYLLAGYKAGNIFKFIRYTGLFTTLLILIYCLLIMMSGDRGPILQIIIAYFTCYCILDLRKYNIIIIVAAVAVGAFIISFLAFFRHYDGTGNLIDMIRHSSAMQADMVSS